MRSRILSLTLALVVSLTAVAVANDLVGASAVGPDLYRVDTSTGQTTLIGSYKLVDKTEFAIPVLARATNGDLLGISASVATSRVYRLDEQTGAATPLLALTHAPVTPGGADVDPTDGSLYWTNTFGIVPWPSLERADPQTGQVSFLGQIHPLGDVFVGLAFDAAGALFTLNASQDALWAVSKTDATTTSIVGTGLGGGIDLSQGGTLAFDAGTGQMIGYEAKGARFFTIDTQTGTGTVVGVNPVSPLLADVADLGCPGTVLSYGPACPGTGGFAPALDLAGCAQVGNSVQLEVSNALGGSHVILLFGLNQTSLPLGSCSFLVTPLLPGLIDLPLGGVGPGQGFVVLPGTLPAGTGGITFTMQGWVADPANVTVGFVGTNGLQVTISN